MRIFKDIHTHTIYSDGKSKMEENVISAINKGLKTIGISDHGYMHLGFGVKYEDYPKMREEIDMLKEKYKEIEILFGVECNILDNTGRIDLDDYIRKYVDYVIAGYHFGSTPTRMRGVKNHVFNYIKPFKRFEIEYNTDAIVNTIKNNDVDIIAHPGDKGAVDIERIAEVAEKKGTILEINERHRNLTYEQLLVTKNYDIKYIISSDAHLASKVGVVDDAISRAIRSGIDLTKIINLEVD